MLGFEFGTFIGAFVSGLCIATITLGPGEGASFFAFLLGFGAGVILAPTSAMILRCIYWARSRRAFDVVPRQPQWALIAGLFYAPTLFGMLWLELWIVGGGHLHGVSVIFWYVAYFAPIGLLPAAAGVWLFPRPSRP